MASRSLTRETGSSYMVKFFEDNETLVVNRSRIFREGRVKIGDISQIQWGRNQTESSEGQILDVGEYTELMNKLKTPVTKPKKTVKKTVKRDASSLQQKENTPPPRKKLKSGVSQIPLVQISVSSIHHLNIRRNLSSMESLFESVHRHSLGRTFRFSLVKIWPLSYEKGADKMQGHLC